MSDRPKLFDDLAGVAGGAISALAGLRDEAEAIMRARIDDTLRRLDLVRRDEFDAMQELATKAREAQTAASEELARTAARLAALEHRVAALESPTDARDAGAEPEAAP
jgi:BMFP domain-containing protein YqiC